VGKAGLRRVIAIAMPANAASRHVMEKLGLRYQRDTVRRGFPVVVYAACFDPASV
jgi:RimJ/RimL family protein N-acetyltransferase